MSKIINMTLAISLSVISVCGMYRGNEAFAINNEISGISNMGDINNDNIVDAVDATNILMEYAVLSTSGKSTFDDEQKESADINKDGIIDSSDASCVLAYYSYTSTGGELAINVWYNEEQNTRVNDIYLTKYNVKIPVGGKDISYVVMLPSDAPNKDEIWTTSDEKIATVDSLGYITGVSEGKCTITVKSVDNPSVKAQINVEVYNTTDRAEKIILSKESMNLSIGDSDISKVTLLPENVKNQDLVWTTSDMTVATVAIDGTVTGVSEGTCIITVTSVDNPQLTADIIVTVGNPENVIKEIYLSKHEMNLCVGESDISYVTMLPESVLNKEEIWTTSDENIATVDQWGNVTGVSEGNCVITVTSVDNPEVKADIKITVTDNSKIKQINGITYIDGILIANKSYDLPSYYDPGMDSTTLQQFDLLSNAAAKEGLNIYMSSGYRSYSYQNLIYNNYVSWYGQIMADTFSARPGHSEHQTGLAIDVNTIDDSFANTPEAIWLENHAHEYGFIVRYPKGKENITGYKYEPWHIRYLGVETATAVYKSGLSLEEYLGIDSYYH